MNIDTYGRVTISEQEAFDAMYAGRLPSLDGVIIDGNIEQYNQARIQNADNIAQLNYAEDLSNCSLDLFDESNQCDWFMPEEYRNFPMNHWLLDQCNTEAEKERVNEELTLFIQHGMFDLLFYLKYLVDTMRQNDIMWGVGRGSSVASHILYLIGVHKVNSLAYELDIHEFLK